MSQRFSLFCGIDIGKVKHMACLIDADGHSIIRSHSFANNAAGFSMLDKRLVEASKGTPILIGMEATGHYWYALHEHLVNHNHRVVALNPLQTAQQAVKQIRKTKTDRVDAGHIAVLMKNGDYRPALIPGELGMNCRHVSRLWRTLIGQRARVKQLIRAKLECLWPEFEGCFADPLCVTARAVLQVAATPLKLMEVDDRALIELIEKSSRRKLGVELAQKLRLSAQTTIGMRRGTEGAAIAIRTLLELLDATKLVRARLQQQIAALSSRLPAHVMSLPGADAIRAVSLFGETDPIEAFDNPDQLVAFAGLDPKVRESGQYQARQRKISKRGSPFLRHTLWIMASLAVHREGDLRDYYLRRRREGLHYLSAIAAVSLKLCRVAWRVLKDQRDYTPHAPPTHY